jgi:hypothetical protein
LLAAHYFGLPQSLAEVATWCRAQGIAVIEDCAHVFFGGGEADSIGTAGDAVIGSLTKFLPVSEGGYLIVKSDANVPELVPCSFAQSARSALDILDVGAKHRALRGINGLIGHALALGRACRQVARRTRDWTRAANNAEHRSAPAGPSPLDECRFDVRVATSDLAAPCRWIARGLPRGRIAALRRSNYLALVSHFTGLKAIKPLQPELPADAVPYVFPLWVEQPDPGYATLRALGMPVFRWDRLWESLPDIASDHGRIWSHHVIQLACHQDLGVTDLDRFATDVRKVFNC